MLFICDFRWYRSFVRLFKHVPMFSNNKLTWWCSNKVCTFLNLLSCMTGGIFKKALELVVVRSTIEFSHYRV